jgi:formylglycine-generating enzyme required for sulfatase activity
MIMARFLFFLLLTVSVSGQSFGRRNAKPKAPKNMVLIPGGTFEMGTAKEDLPSLMTKINVRRAELFEEEIPKHPVKLSPFFMDKFEATNGEFAKFVRKHPEWSRDRLAAGMQNGKYLSDWNGDIPPKGKESFPVVFVTWHAAVAFCREQEKRLPTEAEWEFAARGGLKDKAFPWGDEIPDKTRANYGASGSGAPVKVGSYSPNGYGLFDMAGNVWEFLADEWGKYPATAEVEADPIAGGTISDFMKVTTRRSLRGGSFGGGVVNLRVAYRDSHVPTNAVEHVGFRCAKSAK